MTIAHEKCFPRSLLKAPPEKRYEYYKVHSVAHPVLQVAFDTIRDIIREPAGKQIVMVIGPPRAGKTFLLEWLESELKYEWAQIQASDPGRIPVASIEIPARDTLKPSWALIYERILKGLEEPLINKKIIYGDIAFHGSDNGKLRIAERVTGGKLRIALESALRHRRPFAVFFDEFQHLLSMAGLSWQDQMDCVKSLSNIGHTLLGLFGTYEGIDLIDLSDQLTLRTKIVHLRRYSNNKADISDFGSTINSFQVYMPLCKSPELLEHFDYLYERSLGCVGSLRNWLLQAYRTALREDASTLTVNHLKKHVPLSATQAQKMLANLTRDEMEFTKIVGGEDVLNNEDKDSVALDSETYSPVVQKASDESTRENKLKRKRRRIGERKPERDVIGRNRNTM